MPDRVDSARRRFLTTGSVGLVGIALGFETLQKLVLPTDRNAQSTDILRALGIDRLELNAHEIIGRFARAPLGQLSVYSQLFWPFHYFHPLRDLDKACDQFRIENPDFPRLHRLHTLPVIARLHALPDASDEVAEELVAEVIAKHRNWADPSLSYSEFGFSRREAIEATWQGATAALLRNVENWAALRGDGLAMEAAKLCHLFLKEHFPELLLPAVSAFQFLLTYERALAARGRLDSKYQLRRTLDQLVGGSSWFSELDRLYESIRIYEDMPPQINEVLLGNQSHRSELIRYAINVRIESSYQSRNAGQKSDSPFVGHSSDVGTHTFQIFKNYGVSDSQVRFSLERTEAGLDARRSLSRAAKDEYLSYPLNENNWRGTRDEEREGGTATLIQSLIPFRSYDELSRVRGSLSDAFQHRRHAKRNAGSLDKQGLIDAAKQIGTELFSSLMFILPKQFEGRLPVPNIDGRKLHDSFDQELSTDRVQGFLNSVEALVETSSITPSSGAATSEPGERIVGGFPHKGEQRMHSLQSEEDEKATSQQNFSEFVKTLDMSELDRMSEQEGREMLDEFAEFYERAGISKR